MGNTRDKKIVIILEEGFYFLSALSCVLVVFELLSPGLIAAYLNLNIIFIAWFIGAISLLVCTRERK